MLLAEIEMTSVLLGALGGFIVGLPCAFVLIKMLTGRSIASANERAQQVVKQAEDEAKSVVQRAEIAAEKATMARKEQFEKESAAARDELRETERRLTKRQDLLDSKLEQLSSKEEALAKTQAAVQQKAEKLDKDQAELTQTLNQQREKLLNITGLSMQQATELLLQRVETEAKNDVAKTVRKITEEAEAQAKDRAREVTLMAIQRYATEHTSESTVRSVAIPSDDMKGRIIGREGRNIRAIEKATGVDIIVDDTPGVIVVSCFDKVRQAIAVESLNRLIADGRMHPARIEEIVEKVRSEMDERITKIGRDTVAEVNLRGLHPKIIETMGRLNYRTSFGQNVLRHSVEVAFLCQIIADQLGFDGALARRCGFLHDIGKAMDQDVEGTHPKIGYDFAKQYGEKEPVLNAIAGHHGDVPSTSFYTPIVMAADAISSARPGARRESLEKYVQRLEQLQGIALAHEGVTEAYAIQAGREVRVMVDAKKVPDDQAYLIAQKIAKQVSDEMTFPGEIRVTVLRETRAIEIAR
jgi:ribonuclease Y